MREKLIGTICLVLGITIIVTTGTSFAYFTTVADENQNITGEVADFGVSLSLDEIYVANRLIPLEDTDIIKAVNNTPSKCIDNSGYEVCSLYKVTLTNSGEAQILNGFIQTKNTEYITDNLKAQLLNSDLSGAVSNVLTLSRTLEEKKYFQVDSTNLVSTQVNNTPVTYYLAIWLTETHDYQDDDYNKNFTGSIAFESVYGQTLTAEFNS